jgi:transposase-like protein
MSNHRKFSADIGVNEATLGNWVRAWKQEHPEAGANQQMPSPPTKPDANRALHKN